MFGMDRGLPIIKDENIPTKTEKKKKTPESIF